MIPWFAPPPTIAANVHLGRLLANAHMFVIQLGHIGIGIGIRNIGTWRWGKGGGKEGREDEL
jgi:hypothetical protein